MTAAPEENKQKNKQKISKLLIKLLMHCIVVDLWQPQINFAHYIKHVDEQRLVS